MTETNSEQSLPKPRLILRLGGLGNRKFGRNNDTRIDEVPATLQDTASAALDRIFGEIDRILLSIHKEDRWVRLPRQDEHCRRWKTHLLSWMFGVKDRWERDRYGQPGNVFSETGPQVQVLTGSAEGGDTMIREAANRRAKLNSGTVDCKSLIIDPVDPASIKPGDGLGVGRPPDKRDDLSEKMKSGMALTRDEAAELSRIARQRAYAYRAQSEALRHHSDILLAVWDPDAEGKAGGTSESVELALRERIPVIAVRLRGGGKVDIHVLESVEHLRALHGTSSAMPEDDWVPELTKLLECSLSFPDSRPHKRDDEAHTGPTAYDPRAAFAVFIRNQPIKPIWPARLWRWFEDLASFRVAKSECDRRRESEIAPEERRELERKKDASWSRMVCSWWAIFGCACESPDSDSKAEGEAGKPEATKKTDGPFFPHYGRARMRAARVGMSGVYGDAHRGGIIASYVFAALAVLFAVAGTIAHVLEASTWVMVLFALGELAFITVMYALSVCSKVEGWNLAYIHSRILAEALRIMEYLGPMGVHTPIPRLPHYLRGDSKTSTPEEMWTVWYFRALVRMAPLRLCDPPAGGLDELRAVLNGKCIESQITYHSRNTAKQETLHRDIEKVTRAVFGVVGCVAAFHLADVLLGLHWHWSFILCLIVCVAGPAFIAALHGFASQIENARLRQRSASMVELLTEQAGRINCLDLSTQPAGAEAVWGLSTEALATAVLMMDEAASWSMLYTNTDIHAG